MNTQEQLLALLPPPKVGSAVRQSGYNLSWKFDTQGTTFTTKNIWPREDITNNELAYYTDNDNFVTSGSELDIVVRGNPDNLGGQDLPYTSGLLSTRDEHAQTYGKFELEAVLPKGRGLWPAFWLLPEFATWPEEFSDRILPEIDVMESIGDDPSIYYGTLHHYENQIQQRDSYTHFCPEHDLTAGPHRYGLEWTPSFMAWYFDGVYKKVIQTPPFFNVDFHMIVNLAVGGDWPGTPESSDALGARLNIFNWHAESQVHIEDHPNYDILKRLLQIKQAHDDCHYIASLDQYISELIA